MHGGIADRSIRVKGFGQPEMLSENEATRFRSLSDMASCIDDHRISPKEVTSLDDYIKEVESIVGSRACNSRPVFFRGQDNINYFDVPGSLRTQDGIDKEHTHFEEAILRAPDLFSSCENTMEKLVAMQHYGLGARCLDLTESPLAALYFACKGYIKFGNPHANDNMFGTVALYQPGSGDQLREDMKYHSSSTVSILANTATLGTEFRYGNISIKYHNDGHESYARDSIHFSHIVSHSVIVKVKRNNPRIRNQGGLFIIVNANEIVSLDGKPLSAVEDLMQDLLAGDCADLRLNSVSEYSRHDLFGLGEWGVLFRKVVPYDEGNKYEKFRSDPFDLARLHVKDDDGKRIVFFVPPAVKQKLLIELEHVGIKDDFIYPEYDTILTMVGRDDKGF